jgi:hypothetical protein
MLLSRARSSSPNPKDKAKLLVLLGATYSGIAATAKSHRRKLVMVRGQAATG